MRTHVDCIPCYFKQAIEAARMAGANYKKTKRIVDEVGYNLRNFDMEARPPEVAKFIHQLIKDETGNTDPYKKIKQKSNFWALSIIPDLEEIVMLSKNKILTATRIAIAGNVIDYGSNTSLNVQEKLEEILADRKDLPEDYAPGLFQFKRFREALENANKILYIGDNAGEVIFDKIFISEIKKMDADKEITFAARDAAIINDCLIEDAKKAEIDNVATIISSGSNAPGTILHECSGQFINLFEEADMIISKGQGNYESLEGTDKNIFYLFTVKCPVMARQLDCNIQEMILI